MKRLFHPMAGPFGVALRRRIDIFERDARFLPAVASRFVRAYPAVVLLPVFA